MKSKLAAVAAISMLGLLFPGGPGAPERAEAAFPGDNGKLVFELNCVDDEECDPSGNGIHELTDEGPRPAHVRSRGWFARVVVGRAAACLLPLRRHGLRHLDGTGRRQR